MRPAVAARGLGLLALLLTAAVARSEPSDPSAASVYGLELETGDERERLLIFASRPVVPRLIARDAHTLELRIEGAVLDPSAPGFITPTIARSVHRVWAAEDAGDVVVTVLRTPGRTPELSSRGSMVALDFPAVPGEALQFRDADISDVIREVARATGELFVFDPEIEGRITVSTGDPVSMPEARELLESSLLLLGHTALPTPSGAYVVVPIESESGTAPWKGDAIGESDRLVTMRVGLRYAQADALVAALEPWLGDKAFAIPVEHANSVILGGAESHLQSLLVSVRALDDAQRAPLLIRQLRHRSAVEVERIVRGWAEREDAIRPVEVWGIPRTETLVVRAAPEVLADVREVIERVDRPDALAGEVSVYELRHRDAEEIAGALAKLATGDGPLGGRDYSVTAYPATNALLIRSDPDTRQIVFDVASELDRPTPQIRVSARLLEVTMPTRLRLALDSLLIFGDPISQSFNSVQLSPSLPGEQGESALQSSVARDPFLIPIVGPDGVPRLTILPLQSVVVTADGQEVRTRVLMQPELLVTSGRAQELFAGDNVPVPIASESTRALATSQSIERRDVGLHMRLVPTVTESGIRLELDLGMSSLLPSLAGSATQVGPSIRERRIESVVQLEDGVTALIGLSDERAEDDSEIGVPFLHEVPVLGAAFRRRQVSHTRSHLLVTLTAHVEPAGAGAQVAFRPSPAAGPTLAARRSANR